MFFNHLTDLAENVKAGYFTLIVLLMAVSALCLFLTMLWVGLQCVNVTFPGHTHLPIERQKITNPYANSDYVAYEQEGYAYQHTHLCCSFTVTIKYTNFQIGVLHGHKPRLSCDKVKIFRIVDYGF